MINNIIEMFSYPFMQRAIIVGILVALCSSLLGTSLVLKRYSMIGDGLSHMGFAALAVAYAMNLAPLAVSIPVCVIAAFLLLRMNENSKIKGDAATAIMCSGALAVGVMTVSLTTGMNTDVCNYMFGSILAMSKSDVQISIVLSIAVIILFVIFYPRIFAVTFDETFSKAIGTKSDFFNMVIALLTAITVVLGMRMMGTLLISSLIVFPSLSAMRICRRFLTVVISSVIISVLCFCVGIYISYEYSTPTGASIVMINIIVFIALSLVEKGREKVGI
jgi:zinc transport system permease protein